MWVWIQRRSTRERIDFLSTIATTSSCWRHCGASMTCRYVCDSDGECAHSRIWTAAYWSFAPVGTTATHCLPRASKHWVSFVQERLEQRKYMKLPEIAVVGRTNSGKSSLINHLLAKTVIRPLPPPRASRSLTCRRCTIFAIWHRGCASQSPYCSPRPVVFRAGARQGVVPCRQDYLHRPLLHQRLYGPCGCPGVRVRA